MKCWGFPRGSGVFESAEEGVCLFYFRSIHFLSFPLNSPIYISPPALVLVKAKPGMFTLVHTWKGFRIIFELCPHHDQGRGPSSRPLHQKSGASNASLQLSCAHLMIDDQDLRI